MDQNDLKKRTKQFALRIVKLVQYLEQNCGSIGRIIGHQLLRSGTSVFANYRAVCRAKSLKDFISKLSIVVEEADEALGWLELLIESGIVKLELIGDLMKEADEITAIMTASRHSSIRRQKQNNKS